MDIVDKLNRKLLKQDSIWEENILRLIHPDDLHEKYSEQLSISVNTVSRHRQEILKKLRVSNSIEACRVARELDLF